MKGKSVKVLLAMAALGLLVRGSFAQATPRGALYLEYSYGSMDLGFYGHRH